MGQRVFLVAGLNITNKKSCESCEEACPKDQWEVKFSMKHVSLCLSIFRGGGSPFETCPFHWEDVPFEMAQQVLRMLSLNTDEPPLLFLLPRASRKKASTSRLHMSKSLEKELELQDA